MPVRLADLEPYVGLGYLSKLFKLMAVVLLILLLSEVVTGLIAQGTTSIPTLLGEMSRLVVLAGLLWGSGDLALLLIDMGHDVRATRILLGRQALHEEHHVPAEARPGDIRRARAALITVAGRGRLTVRQLPSGGSHRVIAGQPLLRMHTCFGRSRWFCSSFGFLGSSWCTSVVG